MQTWFVVPTLGKGTFMQISLGDDNGTTARIALNGRLDILGAEAVSLPLATLSGSKQNIVIDMSGVSFLASIGIRHLMSVTKTLSSRGGQLILLSPTEPVLDVLNTSGITDLIPTAGSEDEVASLLGGA
jgi:anti-sigma B factor antagonist